MVDLGPLLPYPAPVCLHKNGDFAEVTRVCDPVRVYVHMSLECSGVQREAWS